MAHWHNGLEANGRCIMKRRRMIAALSAVFALPLSWFGRSKAGGIVTEESGYPDDWTGPQELFEPTMLAGKVHIVDETTGVEFDAICKFVHSDTPNTVNIALDKVVNIRPIGAILYDDTNPYHWRIAEEDGYLFVYNEEIWIRPNV